MRLRIFWKFFITYAIIAVFCFIFISTVGSRLVEKALVSTQSRQLYNEGKNITSSISKETDVLPLSDLQKTLGALAAYQNARIILLTKEGQIIADSKAVSGSGDALCPGFDPVKFGKSYYTIGRFFDFYEEDMLSVLLPVTGNYEISGYLLLSLPMSGLYAQREEMLGQVHCIAIVIFAIFLSIAVIQHFVIKRPLDKIIGGAREYARGNLNYKLSVKTGDEFQYLAETLNYMSEEMNKVSEYRRKFIANISHDFRSPLTSIKGYVEAIADGTIPPEMQQHYLDIVLYQTERLNKLTEGLLELNKMDNASIMLDITRFDINDLIRQTAQSFEGACRKKGLYIDLVLEEDLPPVSADAGRISQVIQNLVDNAVKFSSNGGVIRLETSQKHDKVLISVSDHGIGISPKNLNRIWDRFYKADESRGKDQTGTGLGLSIVKEILNAHNEKITVVSTPGAGTEFTFSLAVAEK